MPEYQAEGPYEFAIREPAPLYDAFRQIYADRINALLSEDRLLGWHWAFDLKPKKPKFEYECVETNLP